MSNQVYANETRRYGTFLSTGTYTTNACWGTPIVFPMTLIKEGRLATIISTTSNIQPAVNTVQTWSFTELLPIEMRPANDVEIAIPYLNNSLRKVAILQVFTTGAMDIISIDVPTPPNTAGVLKFAASYAVPY